MGTQRILLLVAILFFASCKQTTTSNNGKDEIISLLKNGTDFFASKDFEKWENCWSHSPDALFTYTVNNQVTITMGWDDLSKMIKNVMQEIKPASPKYTRDYKSVLIEDDLAWADFTQTDSLDGSHSEKQETRTLRREDGKWKIVSANIINLTSFEAPPTVSPTHMDKEKVKTFMSAPGTNIRMQDGWGGMLVLYNDLGPSNLAPLLVGLKDNSCQSPHWGYVLDGSINLKYADGKQEVIKAGEVFYMPPGHIATVDKKLKIIDFSPEKEMKAVFAHMGKRMEELKKQDTVK